MNDAIKAYYNDLASTYDQNRFENSYGKYIDSQERHFLRKRLAGKPLSQLLDLGCGTGRFLEFAQYGVDISPNMIAVAAAKFPEKEIREGSVTHIPFDEGFFGSIYSLHVIMHLSPEITAEFLKECHKKLQENGTLIFDFPSLKRRKLTNYKSTNWHAGNAFSLAAILKLSGNDWKFKSCQGILFFPIHRLPKWSRQFFAKIDSFFCRSFLKEYSSYLIIEFKKNETEGTCS